MLKKIIMLALILTVILFFAVEINIFGDKEEQKSNINIEIKPASASTHHVKR